MLKLTKLIITLFLIILLGIFLRFFRLSDFPVQLNHDEVSQLYDAISIAQTGRDIYGNFMPTMFVSVHDFKSPFYTYITSLFYFIFGGGELTIRLPGVFFGVLTIPAVYLFSLKLLNSGGIALAAAFFTSIAPFEIFFSRKSFENGAGIFFMLSGFALLLAYKGSKTGSKLLFAPLLFLGIAMYTYFSHAIILPLLIAVFVLIFRLRFLENWKRAVVPFIFLLIFLIPLFVIVATDLGARYRSETVFITQDVNLGENIEFSKKDNFFESFIARNKAIADFSFNRYLKQFDVLYIFGNGLDFTNQGPLGMGPLFILQLPFLLLGIIHLVKLAGFEREKKFIIAWILIGMLPSGLTFEPHSPHRSIMVFTMLNIISGIGLYSFFIGIKRIQGFYLLKKATITLIVLAFAVNFTYFIHMYFVNFPFEKSQSIHYPFKQVSQFAWSVYGDFDQIIFDPLFGETAPVIGTAAHYYLAYYGNYPPEVFQKQYRLGNKEREVLFDKFSIRKIDWREDQYLKKVLLIGSPWSLPIDSIDKNKIIKQFYFYNGQPAFYAIEL